MSCRIVFKRAGTSYRTRVSSCPRLRSFEASRSKNYVADSVGTRLFELGGDVQSLERSTLVKRYR